MSDGNYAVTLLRKALNVMRTCVTLGPLYRVESHYHMASNGVTGPKVPVTVTLTITMTIANVGREEAHAAARRFERDNIGVKITAA